MKKNIKILFLMQSAKALKLILKSLTQFEYSIKSFQIQTPDALEQEVSKEHWDLILADSLPELNLKTSLQILNRNKIDIPVIVISESISEAEAAELMQDGAADYLSMNNLTRLAPIIKRELSSCQTRVQLKKTISDADNKRKEYENIYSSIPLAFIVWDDKSKVIEWNEMAELIFGYAKQEVEGKNFIDLLFDKKEQAGIKKIVKNLKRDIVENHVQLQNKTKEGKTIWCEWNNSLIHDENGDVTGFISTAMDVTEKITIQNKLVESEKRFNAFMDHIPAGVYIKDENGRYLFLNRFNEENFGVKEWRGKTAYDLFNKETADQFAADDKRTLKDSIQTMENNVFNKYGEHKFFRTEQFIIDLADGQKLIAGVSLEITNEKKSRQLLVESEQKYKALYENAPLSYQSLDENGCFLDLNPMWIKTLGYSREEIIGTWFGDLLHPDYLESFNKNFPEFKRRGSVHNVEFKLRKKDNSYITVVYEGCAGYTPEGKFKQTYCVFKDITKQKETENQLRESKERFELAMRASRDGLFDWDLEKNEIYYSPGWKEMLGYKNNELPNNMSIWERLTEPTGVEQSRIGHEKLINREIDRFVVEFKMKHKDGHWVDIHSRSEAFFNAKGNAIRIVGTHTDVSDQKKYERLLAETAKEYKHLFQNAHDAILIIDPTNEAVLEANERALEIYGYDKDEFIGLSLRKISKNPERGIEKVEQTVKDGFIGNFETIQFHKNGTELHLEINASVIDYKGKKAILSLNHDITERMKTQNSLQESNSRLQLAQAIGKMGSWEWNIVDNSLIWSEELYKIWDLKFDSELTQKKIISLIHPDDRIYNSTKLEQLMKSDENEIEYEFRIFTEKRELKYLNQIIRLIRNENNEPEKAFGIMQNITDKKKAEIDLVESEEKNRAFSEATNEALFFSDKGICVEANKAASEMFGFSHDELIGIFGTDIIAEESKEIVKKNMLSGYEKPYEALAQRKDGSKFWAEFEGKMYSYKGKNVKVTAVRDITERKKFIGELQKSEKKYRTFFENDLTGDYLSTPEGKLLDCNSAFADILGYSSVEEILSTNPINFYSSPDKRKDFLTLLSKEKRIVNLEIDLIAKNGRAIHAIENVVGCFDENDELVTFQGYLFDITERKLAEQKIQQQLEELQKWYVVTLDRENRVGQLKQEVNELLKKYGEQPKYLSQSMNSERNIHPIQGGADE